MTQSPASEPKIRLYTQSMNPFSEKVAIGLALKGLPCERVISDDPEDVARWSPIARTLPVLEIEGRRKADSNAILAWLDERYPEPPLEAPDPKTAEAQRHLASWSDDSFTFYWNRWRAARYPRPGDEQPLDDSLLARILDRVGRRFGRTPRTRADVREMEILAELFDRIQDVESFLGDRPFFHAQSPSIADVAVYSMLRLLRTDVIPGAAAAIASSEALRAYLGRMDERTGMPPLPRFEVD